MSVAAGIQPSSDVSLEELEELSALVVTAAERDTARLERDLRLARSVHTFYGPTAAVSDLRVTAAAFRRFGERVRLG